MVPEQASADNRGSISAQQPDESSSHTSPGTTSSIASFVGSYQDETTRALAAQEGRHEEEMASVNFRVHVQQQEIDSLKEEMASLRRMFQAQLATDTRAEDRAGED